jgi:hypothetical protein
MKFQKYAKYPTLPVDSLWHKRKTGANRRKQVANWRAGELAAPGSKLPIGIEQSIKLT